MGYNIYINSIVHTKYMRYFMPIPKTQYIRSTTRIQNNRIEPAVRESTRIAIPIVSEKFSPSDDYTPINQVDVADSAKYSIYNKFTGIYLRHKFGEYKIVDNKGISNKNARQTDICLAKYAYSVAKELDTGGACYTGVKWTFVNAGIINHYGDMPKGSAKDAIPYFEKNKDKFEKVNVKKEDLSKLPAGMIIVYTKEGLDGHIAITTGKGQEMSDCTDNMKWLDEKGNDANFVVYKLTDNWQYDKHTRKLVFTPPQK